MPYSKEQFEILRNKGFSIDKIVEMEKSGFNSFGQPEIFAEPEREGLVSRIGKGVLGVGKRGLEAYGRGTESILRGAVKGAVSTATGISSIGERGIRALMPERMEKVFGFEGETTAEQVVSTAWRTPEGIGEKVGFTAEQIAEFLVPSAKIVKAERAVAGAIRGAKLPKIALSRAAIEAGVVGGQRALQKGKIDEDVKTAAIVAAIMPIAGVALRKTVGKAVHGLGKKIQFSKIRPSARDIKDGFKIQNVGKYKVGGSLPQTLARTNQKLNVLSKELKQQLTGSNRAVNLNDVYDDAVKMLGKTKRISFGENQAIKRVIEKQLKGEISEVAGKNGLVSLWEANLIKRGAGTKGAWAYGRLDPDAKAVEKVYSAFYNRLKVAIEKNAPIGISGLNKKISELIPISNAVLRRMPIEMRNNAISLTDSIGLFASVFDPKVLAVVGANRLAKSGKFANVLVKAGQWVKSPDKNAILQRLLGP